MHWLVLWVEQKDSILPKTERVILEVANFEAAGIRRTALRYDNRTEASSRYEKKLSILRDATRHLHFPCSISKSCIQS